MRAFRHTAAVIPALLLIVALSLVACPPSKDSQPAAAGQQAGQLAKHGAQLAAGPPADPAPALEFLLAALRGRADDGQAPLGPVWNILASVAATPQASLLAPLRDEIGSEAAATGATTSPPLAGAWLATDQASALKFIRSKFKDRQYTYIQALGAAPRLLRQELDRLDLGALPLDGAILALELLRASGVTTADAALLKNLAQHSEPQIRLRAIGYLIALDQDNTAQRQALVDALASDNLTTFTAALEGVKCSGDAGLADALVPLVANAAMGDEDPAARKDPRVLFTAYALAYLPGEQASLMRDNLLGASDPQVRWQARLGELLQGQPSYWNDAVEVMGIGNKDLWVALQTPEAHAPELLDTYRQAAAAEDATVRLQAALHLVRYTSDNSNAKAIELLARLAADKEPQVQAAAFNSGARLKARELTPLAEAALADEHAPWEVRLAAAGLVLAVAPASGAAEEQAE